MGTLSIVLHLYISAVRKEKSVLQVPAGEYSALPHCPSLGAPESKEHRLKVSAPRAGGGPRDRPTILEKASEFKVSPSRTPGTFSFSSKLRGFPGGSSMGPANERKEQPSPARGCGHEDSRWPRAPLAPQEGTGPPGYSQRALLRTGNPAKERPRSACARAAGDCRATERGRLAESRAADEARSSLGAEVQASPEVAGIPGGRRADRV